MPPQSAILSEPYAGLQAQALGLAEAAGLAPRMVELRPRFPWKHIPAQLWPSPLAAVGLDAASLPELVISVGGKGGRIAAATRAPGRRLIQVQDPRIDPRRFDLVVVNRHDELTGPNVIVTRTALHRVSPAKLAAAREHFAPRFAHLKRPLVAVLLGGANGRFRFGLAEAEALIAQLALTISDGAGVIVTPSRRTDPAIRALLTEKLGPLGAEVWDMTGENPYFGMLALADAIVVTMDSVSMVSEAAATSAPVYLARLPGKSRRNGLFLDTMLREGRVRWFDGRIDAWDAAPMDDTQAAADEVRRRLGF